MLKVRRIKNKGGIQMKNMQQGISGYRIPAYIEDILSHNYCPYFVRMNIVREEETYRFIYRTGRLSKLKTDTLDSYSKLVLLRSLAGICSRTGNYLITPENYLLEPELIYTTDDSMRADSLRILFYPDARRLDISRKLLQFSERIRNRNDKSENELLEHFRKSIETGDVNRGILFLDKNILRMESRITARAS